MYLEKLPKILYPFKFDENYNFSRVLQNITLRANFTSLVKKRGVLFHEYFIKSESLEVLADKVYGDSRLFWIIAFANNIFDPYYDWVFLEQISFEKFLQKKYAMIDISPLQRKNFTLNELEADPTLVHSYYVNDILTAKQYQISFSAYKQFALDGFPETTFYKTYFEHEQDVNDAKRKIKIPKAEFITQIRSELEVLFPK